MLPPIDHVAAVLSAAPRASAVPETRGFLFTDIVGSTEIAERLGDTAFAAFLDAHNALVREQARRHGALELVFLGDGFLVVLPDARAALNCAAAIQREVVRLRPALQTPLCLRLGVNAGAAHRQGNTFVGRNVILARRLCEQARPDEVLVAGRLLDLAGTLAERLGAARPRRFKGLAGLEPACALDWR